MATIETQNVPHEQVIEYLFTVRNMTDDRKTLAYVDMAIARQRKLLAEETD